MGNNYSRYERNCQKKKQYKDKLQASKAADYYYGANKMKQKPYECESCGLWHLMKIACFIGLLIGVCYSLSGCTQADLEWMANNTRRAGPIQATGYQVPQSQVTTCQNTINGSTCKTR